MLKDFNKEYRKSVKDYKENYFRTHNFNIKKKYMKFHINRVINLYNELCFYINELEQFFVNDYFNFNRYGIKFNNGEYDCLINGYSNSDFDWDDGYYIGKVYNCFVKRDEISNNTLWETYSDCYSIEFADWLLKFYDLSNKEQEKLLELIDNNNLLHYYGENGCLMHSIVPIRELLYGTLDNYIKKDKKVLVK